MMCVPRFLAWLLLIVMPLEALAAATGVCCSPVQRALQQQLALPALPAARVPR